MNKNQIILSAIGGTALVGALVLGYFIWDAASTKTEGEDRLEAGIASARSIMKKLPFKAQKSELKVFADNDAAYAEWRQGAEQFAAQGDLVFEATTPAVFKTTLVAEARRLSSLPGCFEGKLVKDDFGFGFRDYVTGGAMPPEKDLKRLQREWNDVSGIIKMLADCGAGAIGISEVTVGKGTAKVEAAEEEASKAKSKKSKKAKGKDKAKAKATDDAAACAGTAVTAMTVEFMTRPSVLVKALNLLMTNPRFIVVEKFTFAREADALASALGGDESKAKEAKARPSRRGRRNKAEEEPAEKEAAKPGFVTDPATAPMIKVTMALSVYDFGSLERAAAAAKTSATEEAEGGTK